MSIPKNDPIWLIAERVADSISDTGYAFIEDDKIDGLAATLQSFLLVARIPVHAADANAARLRPS